MRVREDCFVFCFKDEMCCDICPRYIEDKFIETFLPCNISWYFKNHHVLLTVVVSFLFNFKG